MRLTDKTVLVVLAHRQFSDAEYSTVAKILEREGCRLRIACTARQPLHGMDGAIVEPHTLLSEVVVRRFDAVVLIGGNGARDYWSHPRMMNLLRAFHESGKILAAICIAPVTLGRAGLLDKTPATCHQSVRRELEQTGAIVQGDAVVRAKNILTARGPESSGVFAEALVDMLSEGADA